jgi:hypothetical protein
MQSISLKRQVAVKAIVTETFKKNASAELQENLKQLDLAMQQLEFQGKKALSELEKQKPSPQQIENLKMQIEQERQRLLANKQELLQRLNQIAQLEMNSEFLQGVVDNYVEVKIGDNLYEKMSNTEVILKDGIVVEIRGQF